MEIFLEVHVVDDSKWCGGIIGTATANGEEKGVQSNHVRLAYYITQEYFERTQTR